MGALDIIRHCPSTFENLQVADHSMVTAILAVRNLLGAGHEVNPDEDYHEEDHLQAGDFEVSLQELAGTQPRVPQDAL